MSFMEILLIGIGLSMDAFAVSISNGMVYSPLKKDKWIAIPLFFGVFQGIMPLMGYLTGSLFSDFMNRYSSIIIFLILGFIGGKMIWDGFHEEGEENTPSKNLTYKMLFFQAVATSIDAFAVGVGFCAMEVHILPAVCIIAATTFLCSLLALLLGKKFGVLLGSKAELFGGAILVIIGIKAFF